MVLLTLLLIVTTLFAGWRAARRTRFFLHVFQLETYKPPRYRSWIRTQGRSLLFTPSHRLGAGLLVGAVVAFSLGPAYAVAGVLLPAWALTFISSRRYRSTREKKPLAFTARMTRLAAATGALALLPLGAGSVAGLHAGGPHGIGWYLLGLYVVDLGAPLWVLLGAYAMAPVERRIQAGFKRQARATLDARRDLTTIGITGSFGKTSTKFILAELLKQKYNVLATPRSYNTPMGICLVVNEKLKPDHQVLVLEMGMRYRGDIQELCAIAPPDIGVVTTVGPAHLDTMGTLDNIAREKGDLIEYMRTGGPAVLNIDNEYVAGMADRASGDVWRVSVQGHPEADITAHTIRYDARGASFTVTDDTGTEATFQTRLLGAHNVLNILLAVAVGRIMGLRLRQMAHAVRRVEPVAHRLALRQDGPVTVIDDAFNSNPVGARNAVDILSQMDAERRVIVTPGMVELGDRQDEENRQFGAYIAQQNIDLAVLVGEEQTAPIQEGLREQHFPEERLKVFPTFFDAQDFLQRYLRDGDVVLYENDLPDQYEA